MNRTQNSSNSEFRFKLGAVFPDFQCTSSESNSTLHKHLDSTSGWTVFFSCGPCFNPVAFTELKQLHGLTEKFTSIGISLLGVSNGPVSKHDEWLRSICDSTSIGFPIILDESFEVAAKLGILDPLAANPPSMANFISVVGPDKTNRLSVLYPPAVGRNFLEVLRFVESLLLTRDFSLATPVNWTAGNRVVVAPKLSNDEAAKLFKHFWIFPMPSGKGYLRFVDCPVLASESHVHSQQVAGNVSDEHVQDESFRVELGAFMPDFECKTTKGTFSFHEYLDQLPAWTVLFSHPSDFTPVCTTELGACHELSKEFAQLGVKLIGLSCDEVESHHAWSKDILAFNGSEGESLSFPMIADPTRSIATLLKMLDPLERDGDGIPLSARCLFLIDPKRRLRLALNYPATTGRNFMELLRVVHAVMLDDGTIGFPGTWSPVDPVLSLSRNHQCEKNDSDSQLTGTSELYCNYIPCPSLPAVRNNF